jgi:hypothetical protein
VEASAARDHSTMRFAHVGSVVGPCALLAALTGFGVRIVVAGRGWPLQELVGQALEVLGFLLALLGLGLSALGMCEPSVRGRAVVGLVTSGLALVLPIVLTVLLLWAIVAAFSGA